MNAQPVQIRIIDSTSYGDTQVAKWLATVIGNIEDVEVRRRAHRACGHVLTNLNQHLRAIDHIALETHVHLIKLLRKATFAHIETLSDLPPAAGMALRGVVNDRFRAARARHVEVKRGPVGLISEMLTELAEPPFRLSQETSSTAYAVIANLRS